MKARKIAMIGGGFIGDFYTSTLHSQRRVDRVHVVYSRSESSAKKISERWKVPYWTTDMKKAITDPEIDTVVIGLPNYQHLLAVKIAAEAGKNILVTKPLARNAQEAKEILEIVDKKGVFHHCC